MAAALSVRRITLTFGDSAASLTTPKLEPSTPPDKALPQHDCSAIALSSLNGYSPEMNSINSDDASAYDVVVIGGALSGAATAMLLLRQNPGLRKSLVRWRGRF